MKKSRFSFRFHHFSLVLILLYLLIPVLATLLYSFATTWHRSIMPEGLTAQWYKELFSDWRFIESLLRSLLLSGGTTLATLLIMIPTLFVIVVYIPRLERFMQSLVMMTYALPGVIVAVGLLRAYADKPVPIILVVAGAYFITVLPFMYQGIRNSLRTVNASMLMEAAEVLGAGKLRAFVQVILPNIVPGIMVASLLSFSLMFGEFVLINMMVGGRYETMQIFLKKMMGSNGHVSSAIVSSYFVLMALISMALIRINRTGKARRVSK